MREHAPRPVPTKQPVGRTAARTNKRIRSRTVVRARLIALLDEAITSSRLVLVCAPAGSGKSVLVSSWVATRPRTGAVVRVAIHRQDTVRTRFWNRVAAELQRSVGREPRRGSADVTDPGRLGALVARRAAHGSPVVLVVDENSQTPDPALHRELDQFLQQAGVAVRLVFLTRSDPVLPLHRYRLARSLSEIRADDLRFTAAEAHELFTHAGLDLSEDQIETLLDKTNGWPAGLTFAGGFLGAEPDIERAVLAFTGSGRAVSDFLIKEVLAAQPPNVREVLLRSSVADELPVGLFEALTSTPDGHAVLAFLSRANTFVSAVAGKPHCYEYPPLLREFLRTRLDFEHPELVSELHDIAARWWFDNGSVSEAVGHAVAAGHWADAAAFAVDGLAVGNMLDDRLDSVAERFADIPAGAGGAPAAVVRAALHVREGAAAEAADAIVIARDRLSQDAASAAQPPELDDAALFSVELIEAALAAGPVDVDAGLDVVRIAERHLDNMVGSGLVHPELRALLATYRAQLQLWRGDVHGAQASLLEAADSAHSASWRTGEAASLAKAAMLSAVIGELGDAVLIADRAREEADGSADVGEDAMALAAVASAWVMTEQSLMGPARGELAKAEEQATGLDAVSRTLLEVVRARLLHAKGDYAGAREVLEAVGTSTPEEAPAWLKSWVAMAEDVHSTSEGSTEAADRASSTDPLSLADWQGEAPLELQVARGIMEADAHLRDDREDAAMASMHRSLRLAAAQRIRRPFTQVPPRVRELLRRREELHTPYPWLTTDSAARPRRAPDATVRPFPRHRVTPGGLGGPASADAPRPLVVEELTAKELEVLGHLAELHTTDEIAAGMFISVNTVRTHVRNILRKLGVDRRNEAVRRAWELELLPSSDRDAPDGL